jgi:PAS domain S-box-containing protein
MRLEFQTGARTRGGAGRGDTPPAGRIARLEAQVLDLREALAVERADAEAQQHAAVEAQSELERSRELYATLYDEAPVGFVTLDRHGFIRDANHTFSRLVGVERTKCLDTLLMQFIPMESRRLWLSHLSHCRRNPGQEPVHSELCLVRADGRRLDVEVTSVREPRSGEPPLAGRFRTAVADRTEQKRAEAQLYGLAQDLTERKDLERALLEAAARERQRLGRDLHDGLGQHLHALFFMARLLEQELRATAPAGARLAGRLARELEHALELTRSLARGLQPVGPVPEGLMLALRELVQRTRSFYRLDCRFDCRAPVLIHKHSTANHLYLIAQEAVNNAVKHARAARLRITLSLANRHLVLRVHDNGVGVRPDAGTGPGMGLRILRQRADIIRGEVRVQSKPGRGSTVVCTVPLPALGNVEPSA